MTRIAILLLVSGELFGQTLYLADSDTDRLLTVDINTGAATVVGSTLPMNTPCGLAHDGINLHALDLGSGGGLTGGLFTLDTLTGAPTGLGATGLTGWQDIAWDAVTGQFYGVNQAGTNNFHAISNTGVATLVGTTTGANLVTALAFDASGVLWGIAFSPGVLGNIDKNTGTFTTIASTIANIQGMSFHPVTGVLYATNTTTDSLYTIDTVTGVATLIGAHGAGVLFGKGLTFEASACPVPQYQLNYLAASLTLDGVAGGACSPAITTVSGGVPVVAAFSSVNTGLVWEAVLANAALVPPGGGAIGTAFGQILNVSLTAPVVVFLNGGAAPGFTTPFPGNFTVGFVAPPGPLTISAQMLVADPIFPDGFVLSQGCQLSVP